MTVMQQKIADTAKREAILAAALDRFLQYGFRRTSMEDIARAAGMSRPALYLLFRNKEDIFRSLSAYYFDTTADAMRQALAQPGSTASVLHGGLLAWSGKMGEALLTSPHGHELLDAGNELCADTVTDGKARLAGILADWLAEQDARHAISLKADPQETAELILAAVHGIKEPPYDRFLHRLKLVAQMFADGMPPR